MKKIQIQISRLGFDNKLKNIIAVFHFRSVVSVIGDSDEFHGSLINISWKKNKKVIYVLIDNLMQLVYLSGFSLAIGGNYLLKTQKIFYMASMKIVVFVHILLKNDE